MKTSPLPKSESSPEFAASPWVWAGGGVFLHATLLLGLLVHWVYYVPQYILQFSRLGIELPSLTELIFTAAGFTQRLTYMVLPLAFFCLATEGYVLWQLAKEKKIFLLGILLNLGALLLGGLGLLSLLAVRLPLREVFKF